MYFSSATINMSGAGGRVGEGGQTAETEGRGQRGGVHQDQHRGVQGPRRGLRVGEVLEV